MDGDIEVLAVVGHHASTRGVASVGVLADHAGSEGRGADIDGVVTVTRTAAGSGGVGADKGAGLGASVETAGALGALCGELDALHVDLAGDVEAAVGAGAEGELEDGLVEKTHVEVRVGKGDTASTGETIGSGELLGLARGELDRDEGLVGVDPHGGLGPAPDYGVVAGGVGEGGRVLATVADPDLSVVRLVVGTDLGSELGGVGLDVVENVAGDVSGRAGGRSRSRSLGRGGSLGDRRSDNLRLGRSGRLGGGRSGGGRGSGAVAVVDLAPVDGAQVVGNGGPVDGIGTASLYVARWLVSMRQGSA